MIDAHTQTRRVEMDRLEVTEAIRAWLARKGVIPPPDVHIVLTQANRSADIKLATSDPVVCSLVWNTEVSK